jgi:benzylsuccinate CoA-transferase BbsF subunit
MPMGVRPVSPLPLQGIRVLDFSWIIAGPLCTQLLAMLGAEVIRVETSEHPDVLRRIAPYAGGIAGPERSGYWHGLNLSKRSIAVNLQRPEGQELARRLVQLSDVIVQNFAPGQIERFGLGYDACRRIRPDIIMASGSGLGLSGPRRDYVALGPPLVAYTGLASITGHPGRPERWMGGQLIDHSTGMVECFAILAALWHRGRTGEGQHIELSMAETFIAQMPEGFIEYTLNGIVPGLQGNRDEAMAPHGIYPCRGEDRWVAIAVEDDAAWRRFCAVIGREVWARDASLATLAGRKFREEELDAAIRAWTAAQAVETIVDRLQAAGIASAPVNTPADLLTDPQLILRGLLVAPAHAEAGVHQLIGLPWRMSGVPEPRIAPPPLLGADTGAVIGGLLGLSDLAFAELVGAGALV